MQSVAKSEITSKYAKVADVAKYLALSIPQVYKMIECGHLSALRLPGNGRKPTIRVLWSSVHKLELSRS